MNHQEKLNQEVSQEQSQHSTPTNKLYPFELTLREIALIDRIRKLDFGVMEIHKIEVGLVRTIVKVNERLFDEDGLEILKEVNQKNGR